MKQNEKITIEYLGVSYKINYEKLLFILSKLENKEIESADKKTINELLEKYNLYDEIFLKSINKI